jgi:hypothetical protein
MKKRHMLVGALFALLTSWNAKVLAAQASASDVTDFIGRMGGWFYPIDPKKYNDPNARYWAQLSYTTTTATGSANTIITMTRYNQQREDSAKGTICSTDTTVTDTVALDLRELQAKTTLTQRTEGPLNIWSVNLYMNGGKHLIRIKTATAPPSVAASTTVATPPPTTSPPAAGVTPAPGTNTPVAASNCPALRAGQTVVASTEQSDTNSYEIQFAGEEQAKYFQMLIASAALNMSPPRSIPAPLQ